MSQWLLSHQALLGLILVNACLAYSQYIVLRAGVFSLATAGFASLGGYAAALLTRNIGVPALIGLLMACAIGAVAGYLLALLLARLRGVYQAIATFAFVQIVLSLMLYAEAWTGGALGLNNLPRLLSDGHLLLILAGVVWLMHGLSRSGLGQAFDAIRQDEVVAASLGIRVVPHHRMAFALSGLLGGLGGALMSYRNYSLVPEDFGFPLSVAVLTYVVLGGRISIWAPLVGAAVLTVLPELGRPLAQYRLAINGLVMILVIVYLPQGIADAVRQALARRRGALREEAA